MKISAAFVATAVACAVTVQAAPLPAASMQERNLNMLGTTTLPAQLYERDEAQLEARGSFLEYAKNAGFKQFEIVDNVVPSHLERSTSQLSKPDPADEHVLTKLRREHEENRAWRDHLVKVFVSKPGKEHQTSLSEEQVRREAHQKAQKDLDVATELNVKLARAIADKKVSEDAFNDWRVAHEIRNTRRARHWEWTDASEEAWRIARHFPKPNEATPVRMHYHLPAPAAKQEETHRLR